MTFSEEDYEDDVALNAAYREEKKAAKAEAAEAAANPQAAMADGGGAPLLMHWMIPLGVILGAIWAQGGLHF